MSVTNDKLWQARNARTIQNQWLRAFRTLFMSLLQVCGKVCGLRHLLMCWYCNSLSLLLQVILPFMCPVYSQAPVTKLLSCLDSLLRSSVWLLQSITCFHAWICFSQTRVKEKSPKSIGNLFPFHTFVPLWAILTLTMLRKFLNSSAARTHIPCTHIPQFFFARSAAALSCVACRGKLA